MLIKRCCGCEGHSDDADQSQFSSSALRASADQVSSSNFAAETHHPSLRRRKWVDKPGASLASGSAVPTAKSNAGQQIRQSTLEKALSLQAELQQRPLSMVVPFGGGVNLDTNNAIINQVADTLLHQVNYDFKLCLMSCVANRSVRTLDVTIINL
jgi:hypothetical protein